MTEVLATSTRTPEETARLVRKRRLLAVVDGCCDPELAGLLRDCSALGAHSLFAGEPAEDLWAVAPYLLELDPDWYPEIQRRWPLPWGVFLESVEPLDLVRRHCRRLLHVESPAEERWYFRYYDPRVLRAFLPACTPAELAALFGPIAGFGWGLPNGGTVMVGRADPAAAPTGADAMSPRHRGLVALRIRDEHLEALERTGDAILIDRLRAHLERHLPERSAGLGPALAEQVRRQVKVGRRLGITTARDLAQYLSVTFAAGWDQRPKSVPAWARRILTDPARSATARVNQLVQEAERRLEEIAS